MPNDLFQDTLNYLYVEMKATKIAQAQAEMRKDVTTAELVNFRRKVEILEDLIDRRLRDYAVEEVEG